MLLPRLICLLLPFGALVPPSPAAETAKIAPADAAKLVADGKAVLVDVREPAEWADTGVAAPAALLAMSDFDGAQKDWKPFLEKNRDKQILVYCRSGRRSGLVAAALAAKGYQTANVGGFKDWAAAGLPVRKVDAPQKSAAAADPAKTTP
jgi:rhodanese-related sulfurtransferase